MWFIADKLVQLTIIPQARVSYEMAGQWDLISNKHKWNNSFTKQIQQLILVCKNIKNWETIFDDNVPQIRKIKVADIQWLLANENLEIIGLKPINLENIGL